MKRLTILSAGEEVEDVKELELSLAADGNVKCCNCFGKQFGIFLKSQAVNIYLPYEAAIPL